MLALVATVGVLVQPSPDRPDPAPADREAIPSLVRGVVGTGSLELETDLAVGAASVAIANPTGAFVITAGDGSYHRLDLPGFDASVYDVSDVRRTGMVGLSLSPDGSRLAYGWHAPLPDKTGQEHGFVPSGVRILDLGTGRVRDVPEDRATGRVQPVRPGPRIPVGAGPLRAALVGRRPLPRLRRGVGGDRDRGNQQPRLGGRLR